MKVVEKNCIKKANNVTRQKNMAFMGERSYISSVPNIVIDVMKSARVAVTIAKKN